MMSAEVAGGAQLVQLIAAVGDACLVVAGGCSIVAANSVAERLYLADSGSLVGSRFSDLCGGDPTRPLAEIAACNGSARSFSAIQRRSDGTTFLGEFSAKRCHELADGHTLLLVRPGKGEESSPCKDELAIHQELLNSVMDGICAHTVDGELLYANDAALMIWKKDFATIKAEGPYAWVPPENRRIIAERVAKVIDSESAIFENHHIRSDGHPIHTEIRARLVDTTQGRVIISSMRDISERITAEEMVRYLAYHDSLTGLANRVLFEQELAHALSLANRYEDHLGVLFIDLDDFKPVNDTFGHSVGDDVLREVANRIVGAVRDSDTVARFGGDEFVVLLPRLKDPDDMSVIARKLSEEISRPIQAAEGTVTVVATLGLAVHDRMEDAASILTRADLAMYEARETGINGWELFAATL